tara:strand:+ start:1822 stop:2055 length:234 start_codon:yes stop_codon:yes gene_type:complete
MILINLMRFNKMSKDAKLQAYNDMLREEKAQQRQIQRVRAEFNRDAINQAELYRFIFGNEFVNTNSEIIKYNNERLV